jgi:hypothetical protein
MKKRLFFVLASFVLLVAGCGGGGSDILSSVLPVAPTTGGTGSWRVVNNSSRTIMNLYISPTSSSSWGVDQLGSSTIAPGASFTVNNIPAGTYDSKIVMSSGNSYTINNIVIAAGQTTTINNPAGNTKQTENPVPVQTAGKNMSEVQDVTSVDYVAPADGQGEAKN